MKSRSLFLILLLTGACTILGVGIGSWIVLNSNSDTTSPEINIINPTNGANVSNSINISFQAVDENNIISYEIHVDNQLLSSTNKTVWNTTEISDGLHNISCRAKDKSNNWGKAYIIITVDNIANIVVINEFLPDPSVTFSEEWIELYNPSSVDINISGYVLDDIISGGTANYTIPVSTIISAGGFLVFNTSVTGIALNNGGDDVNFIAPDGTVLDSYTYTVSADDISIGRTTDGSYTWTTFATPTKGTSNG